MFRAFTELLKDMYGKNIHVPREQHSYLHFHEYIDGDESVYALNIFIIEALENSKN